MSAESSFSLILSSTVTGVTTKARYTGTQSRTNPQSAAGSITASSTSTQLQIVGTVTEDLILVKNDGDTNVVHVQTGSSGSTGRFATIKAGGGMFLPVASGVSYYVICESGQTTVVSFTILSD